MPFSLFTSHNNNVEDKMRLDREYDEQVSRLISLLKIASRYMKNYQISDQTDSFNNSASRQQALRQQAQGIHNKLIPSEKSDRDRLAKALTTLIPDIDTFLIAIKGRKVEPLWGTRVSELTNSLKSTCDMLDGTISFNEYAKLPDEIQGASWPTIAFTLTAVGIGLFITGCALAYILTGPIMAAAVCSCLALAAMLAILGMNYFLPRTGLSSFAWNIQRKTEIESEQESLIQALFRPTTNSQDRNNFRGSVTYAYFSVMDESSDISIYNRMLVT